MRKIFEVNRERRRRFDAYAGMPEVRAVVQTAIRAGRTSTPDIKFVHDDHLTGYAVALRVEESAVAMAYRALDLDAPVQLTEFGHAGGGAVQMRCSGCGVDLPDIGVDKVLERAVQSLVARPRNRCRIDVRNLT